MPTATALLWALRRLLVLQLLPLLLARQLVVHMLAAAAAARCPLEWRRRSQPSMVVLSTNCRGGYHSDLRRARHSLERTVEAGAPDFKCARPLLASRAPEHERTPPVVRLPMLLPLPGPAHTLQLARHAALHALLRRPGD